MGARRIRGLLGLCVTPATWLMLAAACPAAVLPGRVAFSVDGGAVTSTLDGGSVGGSVALPGGEVLLAGGGPLQGSTFYAAELEQNGSLDPAFGVGGIEHVPIPLAVSQVLREGNGKLLVVGTGRPLSPLRLPQLMVVRLNANGSIDTDYGRDGVLTTALEQGCACSNAELTPQGDLLLVGATGAESPAIDHNPNAPARWHWALQELTNTGATAATFGKNGIATIAPNDALGINVATLPDGEILTDGQTQRHPAMFLTALTPAGAVDAAYASGVPVRTPFSSAFAMLAGPSGEVTLASATSAKLARYTGTGTLDAGFGADGLASVPTDEGQLLAGPGADVLLAYSPQGLAALDGSPLERTIDVRAITASGGLDPALAPITLALPFGGGVSSSPARPSSLSARPLPALTQDSLKGSLLARSDGSYLVVGTVGIAEPVGQGEGHSIWDFAAAAFTSTFAPNPAFGSSPPTLHLAIRVPPQSIAADRRERVIPVTIDASQPALALVTISTPHGLVARSVDPIWRMGSQREAIQLTRLGASMLRGSHTLSIAVRATARDLLTTTASARTHSTLTP